MIYDNADEVFEDFSNHFLIDVKLDRTSQWEMVTLYLILFVYCTTNITK